MKSFYWYVNDDTGEGFGTNADYEMDDMFGPRMTAQALAECGVELQRFKLL